MLSPCSHLPAFLVVASRGRRGLHEALVNFELLGLGGGGVALLQGDKDGRSFLALEPILSLYRRLRPDGVWVQILLEEVGLRQPQGGAVSYSRLAHDPQAIDECDCMWSVCLYLAGHRHDDGLTLPVQEFVEPGRKELFLYILFVKKWPVDNICVFINPGTALNPRISLKTVCISGKNSQIWF